MKSSPSQTPHWRYVAELDGLRALAIVAVMLHHFVPRTFEGGYFGVTLFFVLSGYLITGLLVSEWNHDGRIDLGAFYVRRALRLYPALVTVVLGFSVVALFIGHPGLTSKQFLIGDGTSLIYVSDFIQAAGALGGGAQWFAPTWSLGVEEQFYLLCPIVILLLLRKTNQLRIVRSLALIAIAMAVLYPTLARLVGTSWMYFSPIGNLLPLLIGCTAALTRYRPRPLVAALAAVLLITAILEAPWFDALSLWNGFVQLVALSAGLVVVYLAQTEFAPLRWHPLVWLGRRSYGVYLIHMPMLYVLQIVIPERRPWFYALAGATASIVAAGLMYRKVETPFLALKQRFSRGPVAARTQSSLPGTRAEAARPVHGRHVELS